jgi:hypothetical protein
VPRLSVQAILVGMLAVSAAGCRSEVVGTVPKSYDNLRKVGSAYQKATDALNRGPSKLDELLPFLAEFGDPADVLRSPRDN